MITFWAWCVEHRYVLLYTSTGLLGAIAKSKWTSPAGQRFADICNGLGLGLSTILVSARAARSAQDDIPTNPEMKVPEDSKP